MGLLTNHQNYRQGKLVYEKFTEHKGTGKDGNPYKFKKLYFKYRHPTSKGGTEEGRPEFQICQTKFPYGVKKEGYKISGRATYEMYDALCTGCVALKDEEKEVVPNCENCQEIRQDITDCVDVKERLEREGYVSLWKLNGYVNFDKESIKINKEDITETKLEFLKDVDLYEAHDAKSRVIGTVRKGTIIPPLGKEGTFIKVSYSPEAETFKVVQTGTKTTIQILQDTHMYSERSRESDVLFTIKEGEVLHPLDEEDGIYKVKYGGKDGFYMQLCRDIAQGMIDNKAEIGLTGVSTVDQLLPMFMLPFYYQKTKETETIIPDKNPTGFLNISFFQKTEGDPKKGIKKQEKDSWANFTVPGVGRNLTIDELRGLSTTSRPAVILTQVYWGTKIIPKLYISSSVVSDMREREQYVSNKQEVELNRANEDKANLERLMKKNAEMEAVMEKLRAQGLLDKDDVPSYKKEGEEENEPTNGEAEGKEPENKKSMKDFLSGGPTLDNVDLDVENLPGMDF